MSYWLYRTRQFLNGLTARVDDCALKPARQVLSPAALELFLRLSVDAQYHSLNVLRSLQDAGHSEPDLLQAALLHDVGKAAADRAGVRLGLWMRAPLVLLEEFAPRQLARWAAPDPEMGWRYALHVHIQHPRIGAEWAAGAGCSATTCWLIEHHQVPLHKLAAQKIAPEMLAHLRALQQADNAN